jgi:hypothetical protein
MHKEKISEIQKELGDEHRINALNTIGKLFQSIMGLCNSGVYGMFAGLVVMIFFFLAILGPIANFYIIKQTNIALFNLIICIFYLISLAGSAGKCKCCCFYKPNNWIFLMVLSDLVTFLGNIEIVIMASSVSMKEFDNQTYVILTAAFNCLVDLYLIQSHCKSYVILRDVYIHSREYEIIIIKKCVNELVKKL